MLPALGIRSKLLLAMLAVSVVTALVVGYQTYITAAEGLEQSEYERLNASRTARTRQLESDLARMRRQLRIMGTDPTIAAATKAFRNGFQELQAVTPTDLAQDAVRDFYEKTFLPRLSQNVDGAPNVETYLPDDAATIILQASYIALNDAPLGKKATMVSADLGGSYSESHLQYHPRLRQFAEEFDFYDVFLIDIETGDLVYTVAKEVDFATNLFDGPYAASNLATAVRMVRAGPDPGTTAIVDFAAYRPSYAQRAAFIATPIYDDTQLVGILAAQLSNERINRLMTAGGGWQREGLGETGETYLVGEDRTMRSLPRTFTTDPQNYFANLLAASHPAAEITAIQRFGTTVGVQRVDTAAVQAALRGRSGVRRQVNYLGQPTLASYGPVNVDGLNWAMISEMTLEEAYAPIQRLQRRAMLALLAVILGVTLLSAVLAGLFLRPLTRLIDGVRKIESGDTDVAIKAYGHDELARLAHAFNDMAVGIRKQQEVIRTKNLENEKLLFNILPKDIAQRFKRGDEVIADRFQNVTVVSAELVGFDRMNAAMSCEESLTILNDLISTFDAAARQHAVEKVRTVGDGYLAACGLGTPRLDHARRALEFAREMIRSVDQFNRQHTHRLTIRVGVHSGSVTAGVVGRTRFLYDIWGDTVTVTEELTQHVPPRTIGVSDEVHHQLADLYPFHVHTPLTVLGKSVSTHLLKGRDAAKEEQVDFDAEDEQWVDETATLSSEAGDEDTAIAGGAAVSDIATDGVAAAKESPETAAASSIVTGEVAK